MTTKKLIVGNWKMNPGTLDEAKKLARKTKNVAANLTRTEAVICPPFVFIAPVMPKKKAKHFHVGAQSVYFEENGSHTGEVSAAMLRDLGVEYVIVGHSEERKRGDTDEMVAKKIRKVLEVGLTPIVCVGELERDSAGATHFGMLREQIKNSFADVPKKAAKEIVLAYEPVWAIGAKAAMAATDIYEMSLFVKQAFSDVFNPESAVKVNVLYGGSVNAKNAYEIMTVGKVDGLLVGRESISTIGFTDLLKVVDGIK